MHVLITYNYQTYMTEQVIDCIDKEKSNLGNLI